MKMRTPTKKGSKKTKNQWKMFKEDKFIEVI